MQLDVDRRVAVLAQAGEGSAGRRLEHPVLPRDEGLHVAEFPQQPDRRRGIVLANQQVDVRHRPLAGRVDAQRVQGGTLQRDDGDAAGAGAGIDALQQRLDAPMAMFDVRALPGQERLP